MVALHTFFEAASKSSYNRSIVVSSCRPCWCGAGSMPRLDVYDMELDDEPDSELAAVRTKKGMGTMMKGLLPQDEVCR